MKAITSTQESEIDRINSSFYSGIINNELIVSTLGSRTCLLEPTWFFPSLLIKLCVENGRPQETEIVALSIELIYQGYSIHYLCENVGEADGLQRGLIAGDFLYARGLSEIKKLSKPKFVEVLAELIEDVADLEAEREEQNLIFENENPYGSEIRSILPWYRMVFEMAARLEGFEPEGVLAARRIGSLVGLKQGASFFKCPGLERDSLDEINSILKPLKLQKLKKWVKVADSNSGPSALEGRE